MSDNIKSTKFGAPIQEKNVSHSNGGTNRTEARESHVREGAHTTRCSGDEEQLSCCGGFPRCSLHQPLPEATWSTRFYRGCRDKSMWQNRIKTKITKELEYWVTTCCLEFMNWTNYVEFKTSTCKCCLSQGSWKSFCYSFWLIHGLRFQVGS